MPTIPADALSTVLCAPTFERDYRRASPLLRERALRAARDLASHFGGGNRLSSKELSPIAGVDPSFKAFRLRLSRGARMICTRMGPVALYRFGTDHDLTKWAAMNQVSLFREQQENRFRTLAEVAGAERLIECTVDSELEEVYSHALDARWIYQLDDEQDSVALKILADIEKFCVDGRSRTHWILGGPGTGKTAILASLLDLLRNDRRFELVLRWPIQVLFQSIAAFQFSVVDHLVAEDNLGGTKRRVMLIDDPPSLKRAIEYDTEAVDARHQFHVCAFDPLQLAVRSSDKTFDMEIRKRGVVVHQLHTSYRQRRRVALTAMNIAKALERSTPYLHDDRIAQFRSERAWQSELANELRFPNPAGTTLIVDRADASEAASLIVTALPSEEKCWHHWPPFLFVYEDELAAQFEQLKRAILKVRALSFARMPRHFRADYSDASSFVRALLDDPDERGNARVRLNGDPNLAWEVPLSSIELIKGVEFQVAVIVIRRSELEAISHGFKGSGRRSFVARSLLRIPISRARDALIFVSL